MTADQRIARLEAENAALREQVRQLQARLAELEGRLAQDSHNSSKPPSSDGWARQRKERKPPSQKKSGGQPGHPGRTLKLVEAPDQVVQHRPPQCASCQQSLEGVSGTVIERRQVHDLPPQRLVVSEHQREEVRCPTCHQVSRGRFPADVQATVQYGPGIRALAVYWQQYQLLPSARTCEALADLYGCDLSEGTLARWSEEASARLLGTMEQIAEQVSRSRVQHADETGVRLEGNLHWLHVNSTRFLTHLAWHQKRGAEALEAIGIWTRFSGRAMRDRWASYDRYSCAMSLCGAHLLRELTYLEEQEQQAWAGDVKAVLLDMHAAAQEWRARGARQVPAWERDESLNSRFFMKPPPA
jgi:transposase